MKEMEALVVANANSEILMYVSRAPSVVTEVGITRNFSILTNIGTQGLLKTNLGDSLSDDGDGNRVSTNGRIRVEASDAEPVNQRSMFFII